MKRIYLDEASWGKGYLLAPNSGKMCCLGFASEQLGAPRKIIKGRAMPSESLFAQISASPDKFKEFVNAGNECPSDELVERAKSIGREMRTAIVGHIDHTLFGFLAAVNDAYHLDKPARRAKIRSQVLDVLRRGFREMGYQLVVKKAS